MTPPDLTGRTLGGHYALRRRIGAGGMGAVYEAIDLRLGRRVAVKVLHPVAAAPDMMERFRREAQVLASLGHVHIVQVSDFAMNPGEPPFLVMEYLEGASLGGIMKAGPIAPLRMAGLAVQALAGLGAAHAAGVVHRDVKPDNIFVTQSPTLGEMVKVLDFGIAKIGAGADGLTRAGTLLGTLPYMSPEQAAGDALDPRSDLYSLGVCMYYACSGALPINEPSLTDMLRAIVGGAIVPLTSRVMVDPRFADIVHHALCRDRDRRFPNAAAMAAALDAYRSTASHVSVAPGPAFDPLATRRDRATFVEPARAVPAPRARGGAGLAIAAGALAAIAGVGALGWGLWNSPRSRTLAPHETRVLSASVRTPPVAPTSTATSGAILASSAHGGRPAPSATPSPGPRRCERDADCGDAHCRSGLCVCPAETLLCAGRCVDRRSVNDCGACGVRCADDELCGASGCQSCKSLAPKGAHCGAEPHACFDLAFSAANCGACGHACGAGQRCYNAACFSSAALGASCRAKEECALGDPRSDCVSGRCGCLPPTKDCGGRCVHVGWGDCPK